MIMSEPTAMTTDHYHRPATRRTRGASSFLTRSTIYNRNEKRRAKTLRNAHDTRPAPIRVLSQLTGQSPSPVDTYSPLETATTSKASVTRENVFDDDEASTVFHAYDETKLTNKHQSSTTTPPLIEAVSAAFGARFSELIVSNRSALPMIWNTKPVTASHHPHTMTAVMNGESLALMPPSCARPTVRPNVARPFLTSNPPFFKPALPSPTAASSLLSRSMAPFVVLFGTKSLVESHLRQGDPAPISMASLASSGVAGASVGILMHQSKATLGTEAGAAILYFGAYELVKGAVLGRQRLNHYNNSNTPWNMLAVTSAGAVAGSLYEVMRVYGTSSALLCSSSNTTTTATTTKAFHTTTPFAPRPTHTHFLPIIARAAPAHAMLFLGYEAAKSVLGAENQNGK